MSIHLNEVTVDELHSLEPDWLQLWEADSNATPFQHPSWLFAWWERFGADKELLTVVLRKGSTLVGIIPLCILREANQRKVMFVGAGLSDAADALLSPACGAAVTHALYAFLVENGSRWETCDLQPIRPDSPLLRVDEPLPLRHTIEAVEPHTVLLLPRTVDIFQSQLSRHFRKRINDALRRAESMGNVCFEETESGRFDDVISKLLHFRRNRWQANQRAGTDQPPEELFYKDTAEAMLRRGELRLFSMSIGGQIVAVLYGFIHQKRAGLYLMGFDGDFAKASPGVLLIWHALRRFIAEGARECDFLRGQEAFKYRWNVTEQPYYAHRIWNGGPPE